MHELLLLAAALVIHELGHFICGKFLGIPLLSFRLSPVGGMMVFDFSSSSYLREAAVHFSGSAAGLAAAAVGWILFENPFFTGINAVLALVNLLPAEGLDGGGILRCLLSLFLSVDSVWKICRYSSAAGVLLLWTVVLWTELRVRANLGLMAFAVYLLLGILR